MLGVVFPLVRFLPALWATYAVPVGTLMTLGVWVGLGSPHVLWRLLAAIAAGAYVAIWPIVSVAIQTQRSGTMLDWTGSYLWAAIPYILLVVVFGGMLMTMRGRYEVARAPGRDEGLDGKRFQFSVLSVLVVVTLACVALALVHAARGAGATRQTPETVYSNYAKVLIVFFALFVNTACAVQATLQSGSVLRNVMMSLLASVLLGIAVAFSLGHDLFAWWLVAGGTLITIIPTAIVIASLLVVRSCGFRLIRKQRSQIDVAA